MAYETEKRRPGREPAWLVEIDCPRCSRTFGVAPCTAVGAGDTKCHNTRSTCLDKANYSASMRTYLHSNRVITGVPAITVAAPTTLAATGVSSSEIDLTWVDVAHGETGYSIEARLSTESAFSVIATVAAGVTSYQHTGLAAGSTYTYRVRAVNGTTYSDYSNQSTASVGVSGLDWVARTAAEANTWRAVAFGTHGGGVFVAVSDNGSNRVMRSTDNGATWSPIAAAAASSWFDVTSDGGSIFVAVANSGANRVMRSTDGGQTWATATAASASQWDKVRYGNGVFIALAYNDNVGMRSTDNGQTWSALAGGFAVTQPAALVYGNGRWIVGGSDAFANNNMKSTDDGVNWSTVSIVQEEWRGAAYSGSRFVLSCRHVGRSRVTVSDDGITWSQSTGQCDADSHTVVYGNGRFIIVGGNTFVSSTTHGRMSTSGTSGTWSTATAPEANNWTGAAFGNGTFVAVASDGAHRVMTS